MSTPEQPLTRKQLREMQKTGSVPVVESPAEPAPEPPAAHPARAAEPIAPTPPPAHDEDVDLGSAPLTRRQARQQERIRTASVPVITPVQLAGEPVAAPEDVEPQESDGADVEAESAKSKRAAKRDAKAKAKKDRAEREAEDLAAAESAAAEVDADQVGDESLAEEAEADAAVKPVEAEVAEADADEALGEPVEADAVANEAVADEVEGEATADDVDATSEPESAEGESAGIEPAESESEPEAEAAEAKHEPEPEAAEAEAQPEAAPVTVGPQFGAGLLAAEEVAPVELPPSFDELIARNASATSTLTTPSALILSQTPAIPPLAGPVNATGEVIITGSYQLPERLGSVGHDPLTTDGREVDAALIDGELPASSSPTPIAASAAISTVRGNDEIIRPPAPEKSNRWIFTLAITAGVLAIAVVGLVIVAVVNGAF